MRIDSSTIGMESERSYKASSTTTRRFVVMDYQQTFEQSSPALSAESEEKQAEQQTNRQEEPSENAVSSLEDWQKRLGISPGRINLRSREDYVGEELRQMTVRYIFDLLFNQRRERLHKRMDSLDLQKQDFMQNKKKLIPVSGKTISLTEEGSIYEREEVSFSTTGTVVTKDGRKIDFQVNVGMSREFSAYYKKEYKDIDFRFCDPLVINLEGDVAGVSDQTFYFDIDADGTEDEISMLSAGAGYLALDRNGDGKIGDGSELFGSESQDGFADLAKYDEDGNGWIDENDSVFSKLQIWCKNASGQDVLYKLSDKGIGAICLQRSATDFTLKNAEGKTNAAIRSTGIFLYENGNVGTLQHVDMAKYQKEA